MFKIDKRILYVILGIIVLKMLIGYANNENQLLSLLLTLPGVIIAITFHEFGHAFAADKLGDDTARMQGRLNLNPFSHIDPIGFIMLIFAGFGWGKPVQINSRNFNRNMSVTKAEAIVAIAGPAMNFILAILFAIIYAVIMKFNILSNMAIQASAIVITIILQIIIINLGLGIFNLIPLPPLDGSKVLKHFLSYKARTWFETNEQIFYIIFIIIWIFGIAGELITPVISVTYTGLMKLVSTIFGI